MNDSTPQPASPEQLLAHLDWARSLARRLVSDPATADDLVQETYVRALESPPRHRPGEERRLRAWFGKVLTNAARQRGRGEGRRGARERERATPEALPSASELTEAAEGQRLLIEALLELDEDLRRIVLLRHYQGLSSTEIARRLGEPAGTIRWRLSAALDDLRGKLDRRTGGDRSVWQRALLPLVRLPEPAATTAAAVPAALSPGASLGGLALGLAAVLSVGLGLALSLMVVRPPQASPDPTDLRTASAPTPAAPEAGPGPSAAASTTPARAPLAEDPASAPRPDEFGARTSTAAAAEDRLPLSVRFVDAAGRGVEGVRLFVSQWEFGPSDASGSLSASLARDPSHQIRLVWMHPDHVTDGRSLPAPATPELDLGEVVLQPGGRLVGQALDELGRPLVGYSVRVPGVEVRGERAGGLTASSASALGSAEDETDAEGRFQLSGLLPGLVDLELDDPTGVYSAERLDVEIAAGGPPTEVELRLEPVDLARQLRGRVVGPDGEPVHSILFIETRRWFSTHRSSFTTGLDGSFATTLRPGVKTADIEVRSIGGRLATQYFPGIRVGQTGLVLALDARGYFQVAPATGAGAILSDAVRVTLLSTDGERQLGSVARAAGDTGPLELLLPAEPFRLRAGARGFFQAELGPLAPAGLQDATLDVELVPRPAIAGQLLGGDVLETEVALHRVPFGRVRVWGLDSFVEEHAADQAAADDAGRYRLFVSEPGRYYLRATAEGLAASFAGPFDLDPRRPFELPTLELTPGGTLEGTVAESARARRPMRVVANSGDGVPQLTLTDTDGRYRFEHLRPGPWQVRAVADNASLGGSSTDGFARGLDQLIGDVELVEGGVVRFDIEALHAKPGGTLVAALEIDPLLGDGWRATLIDPSGASTSAPLDAEGRVELAFAEAGAMLLQLRQGAGMHDLAILGALELRPGDPRLELSIRAGRVEFEVAVASDPDAPPCALAGEDRDQGLFFMRPLEPGRTGALFPAGTVFTLGPDAFLLDPRLAERHSEHSLAPGDTVQIELP